MARSERLSPVEEEDGNAVDKTAQERAEAVAHNIGVQSPGYVLVAAGMHPDHNEPCTFVPGELLPGWAAEALAEQRPKPDEHGVYRLTAGRKPTKPRKATK